MRRLTFPIILVFLLVALPASAGKIGFVNAEQVVAQVEEGKARLGALQTWQGPHQARLDSLRNQAIALNDQINAKQETATAAEIAEIENNQRDVIRRFEDERRDYERELEARKDEILRSITLKIAVIGADYAKANDYDAVFLVGAQPLIYIAETADLTALIIGLYNERHPVE